MKILFLGNLEPEAMADLKVSVIKKGHEFLHLSAASSEVEFVRFILTSDECVILSYELSINELLALGFFLGITHRSARTIRIPEGSASAGYEMLDRFPTISKACKHYKPAHLKHDLGV